MTLADLVEKTCLSVASGERAAASRPFRGAYCSDMLSDVLARAKASEVLITVLNHASVIAVAVLLGMQGVIVTGGREPRPDMLKAAEKENIPILTTKMDNFETAGQLYILLKEEAAPL